MKYEILFNHPKYGEVLADQTVNGKCFCFTHNEEAAQQRVADLATIGVQAYYRPINEKHWVNNWIG